MEDDLMNMEFRIKTDDEFGYIPLNDDVDNYEIVDIEIDSTNLYKIENISLDYLIPKIKSELRKWELNIGFNVKNPIYKENRKTFELKFVFVPSTSKID